ncbi:MAG: glycosyltransferase [Caldilineaceae bacterium]
MMKILHVIPSVDAQFGGPSFAVQTMVHTVAAHGYVAHIATIESKKNERLYTPTYVKTEDLNKQYYYFRKQTNFYTFSWPLTVWLVQNIKQYDVVHIHGLFAYPTLPAAYAALSAGIPYIVRPFGTLNRWGMQNRRPGFKKLSLRYIERPILERAAAIQYTCEQERIEAAETGVVGRPIILPIGVDITTYQKLPSSEHLYGIYPQLKSKTVILFLSRFHPKKGLDLLLKAFAQVQHQIPETMLLIAGDGDLNYREKLTRQAIELKINEQVVWAGFLEGQKKLEAMAIADIFVLPSYSENFGIAVVEAMAAGLPVVISDQVGIHHEISRAHAGRIISCNVDSLALAIKELLNCYEIRHQMGNQARQLAKEFFSTETISDRLIDMYKSVISNQISK